MVSSNRVLAALLAAFLLASVRAHPQQLAPAGGVPPPSPTAAEADIRALMEHASVKAALQSLEEDHDELVRDLVAITEIPAPSFKEQARARFVAGRLREAGLKNVRMDEEGNVLGDYPGSNSGPTLVLAAHLDTVFPEGVDTHVKKNGTVYTAPGIGDDSYGLAALLSVARAIQAAQVRTRGNIIFFVDVGEEGLGNLRGVTYLFEKSPLRRRIDFFVSIDGLGDTAITTGAVASKRYRVTYRGPGGHSYGAFGLVNPAFAMGGTVARLSHFQASKSPKTTYNVGLFGGGTSVNSIPSSVWMEVDLRSDSPAELARIEEQFLAAVKDATDEENHARSTEHGAIVADARLVGDRKGGQTPASSALVQDALAVNRILGKPAALLYSSTDSNVPISLGIPAITIGAGARGGRAHALDEWVDVDKTTVLPGLQRALLLALALVGVESR